MSRPPSLVVLHGLRLGSVVPADALARRSGTEVAQVVEMLEVFLERGWVRQHEGRLPGWSLTRSGRAEGERLLAEQLDDAGARGRVEQVHRDFEPLNLKVLAVCTDWQVVRREGREIPNDHADGGHDLAVLERLGRIHAEVRPLLGRLGAVLDRFGGYEPRLTTALERTLAGHTEWFTRPTIDSYHTVWFELHEDLLATLGRRRSEERPTGELVRGTRSPRSTDPLPRHHEEHR